MKRIGVLVTVIMILCGSSLLAKPVEKEKAEKAAKNFLVNRYPTSEPKEAKTTTKKGQSKLKVKKQRSFQVYGNSVGYIVDLEPSGFILFSSDDKMPAVKLYSNSGSFDQLPPGFLRVIELELLEDYTYVNAPENQQLLLSDQQYSASWDTLSEDSGEGDAVILPATANTTLLSTSWGQGDPYNYYCPAATGGPGGRALAGCGAIALAQILRYHVQPVSIASNYSYTDSSGSCHGTFSTSSAGTGPYDWNNMPNAISTASPDVQKQAIGQLIYHCAVALESDFEADITNSVFMDLVPARLPTLFNYISSEKQYKNDPYTNTEWYNKIKTDIDNNQPVYYGLWEVSGSEWVRGHALVCDGYRNGNEIHLELGWDGSSTAWYSLDTVAAGGYTWTRHGAIFNIAPAGAEVVIYCPIMADTLLWEAAPDWNYGDYYSLIIGKNNDSTQVHTLIKADLGGIPAGVPVDAAYLRFIIVSPEDITVDTYRVTSNWGEYAVTWNTPPAYDSTSIPTIVYSGSIYNYNISMTDHVRDWINNGYTNHGVLLKPHANTEPGTWFEVYSKDTAEESDCPVFWVRVRELVSSPASISGPTTGAAGTQLCFTASGASSNLKHSMEYQYDWGDGSPLSSWGSSSRCKIYTASGHYNIRARARCSDHEDAVSGWSPVLRTVTIGPQISGYVLNSTGTPISGVTVSANNGGNSYITQSDGFYALNVPYNWTGRVTLMSSKIWYEFTPEYWDYENVITNQTKIYSEIYICGGGDGTESSPYQISTARQLNHIGKFTELWNKHFKLMGNIDMSTYTGKQYKIIGNGSVPFSGTFDGSKHIISNLTYTSSEPVNFVGLFGYVDTDGQVKNLGIQNALLSSGGNGIGGVVGLNSGTITSCYATGSVSGSGYAGGLVGWNDGIITSCYATGSVSGSGYVGGLVGYNGDTITSCYATGPVSGGGLVGANVGAITACFWNIQTSGQTNSSGGIGLNIEQMKTLSIFQNADWADKDWVMNDGVDYPRLSWENTDGMPIPLAVIPLAGSGIADDPYLISTAQEFALLSWYSGLLNKHIRLTTDPNLIGVTHYPIGDLGPFTGVFDGNGHTISNIVINQPSSKHVGLFSHLGSGGQILNLGIENVNITGDEFVGGLVGQNGTYDVEGGTVTACYAIGSVSGSDNVGGLVGYNYGTIISCYASGSISGESNIGGLVGQNGTYDVGGGTVAACYATGSVSGEYSVGGLVGYNGYGTITDCYVTGPVNGSQYVGSIVGYNYHGTIGACYASGVVSGTSASSIGGLAGMNEYGTITACYTTVAVSGLQAVGGLAGCNYHGTITACCVNGTVNSYSFSDFSEWVGGLVGQNYGNITACYSSGVVNGNRKVGGLVGKNYNYSTITACYSTGSVNGNEDIGGLVGYDDFRGTIIASFWDIQSSSLIDGVGNQDPDPSGVTGKTTTEMQTLSTFTLANWDFTNETINGTNNYWRMCVDGMDYPRLNWESTSGDFSCPDGVNTEDLGYYINYWLINNCSIENNYCGGADLNSSGVVDLTDWAIFAESWLSQ